MLFPSKEKKTTSLFDVFLYLKPKYISKGFTTDMCNTKPNILRAANIYRLNEAIFYILYLYIAFSLITHTLKKKSKS